MADTQHPHTPEEQRAEEARRALEWQARNAGELHKNVPDWADPCPCEAEPYWTEAMGREHPKEEPTESCEDEPGPEH